MDSVITQAARTLGRARQLIDIEDVELPKRVEDDLQDLGVGTVVIPVKANPTPPGKPRNTARVNRAS